MCVCALVFGYVETKSPKETVASERRCLHVGCDAFPAIATNNEIRALFVCSFRFRNRNRNEAWFCLAWRANKNRIDHVIQLDYLGLVLGRLQ